MIRRPIRSRNARLRMSSLLMTSSLLFGSICMLGCKSTAPVGAENPLWQKFSEKRPQTPKVHSTLPLVVHVNRADGIITIRNGSSLPEDYLLAYSPQLDLKAVLMMQPVRNTQLRTALILEGTVSINDQIMAANDLDREKFSKKFPQ